MKKLNIWIFSAYDQPNGQSSRSFDYAKRLVNLGHNVSLFCNSYCHFTGVEKKPSFKLFQSESIEGVNIIWLKSKKFEGNGFNRGLNMISNFLNLIFSSFFIKKKPDVILAPSVPTFCGLAGYIAGTLYKSAFIFEIRDVWPDALVSIGGISKKSFLYKILRKIECFLYKKSDMISSVLPNVKEHIHESGGNKNIVSYIPNGIECEKKLPNTLNNNKTNFTIMYIGGFGLDHDTQSIIEAAEIIQQNKNNSIQIRLIGSGVNKKNQIKYSNKKKLRNVSFEEAVNKTLINELQQEADVMIVSIKDVDSFRWGLNLNKIYSYMSAAKPIIFSGNSPSNPIELSNCGFCVSAESPSVLAETILQASRLSRFQLHEMGLRGRAFAELHYDISNLAKKMESMMQKAIANKNK